MTIEAVGPNVSASSWQALRPFQAQIEVSDQVLLVATTGGAKSTLVATMTLDVPTLVALDDKGALRLPRARLVELPEWRSVVSKEQPEGYYRRVKAALAWREHEPNRVILRPHVLDIENFEAHDDIFRAVFERPHSILWLDEIGATGATASRTQPWLRAITARGRTKPVGLWTCTQAPYGMAPPILRRNATYTIFGPLEAEDVANIHRPGIELAESIPHKSGRFIVYHVGEREPYRLHLPIPDRLKGWKAP